MLDDRDFVLGEQVVGWWAFGGPLYSLDFERETLADLCDFAFLPRPQRLEEGVIVSEQVPAAERSHA